MSWLSILIPVYNVKPYLEECIESVLAQADQGVQVLLLDDCSTDGSWELAEQLAQRWPGRLELLQHHRNSGLSAARNTMIEAARGDYIWFLDSDDKLLPNAITELADIVKHHASDIVLCDFSVWREQTRLKHRLRGESHRRSFSGDAGKLVSDPVKLLAGLLTTGQMHAWSKISRRELWDQNLRFPSGKYFEDLMTMPLVALRCKNFYYCPHPWVAYRQRDSSILSSMNLAKVRDQSTSLLPLAQALQHDPLRLQPKLRLAWAQQCSRNLVGAMRFLARHHQELTPERSVQLANQFRNDFAISSPYSIDELLQAYMRRGWWLRALKLRTWAQWGLNKKTEA